MSTKNNLTFQNPIFFFQGWIKSEIEIGVEAGEKSSYLVDKEKDLLYEVKIEIDNAEEELVQDGEYVVFLQYPF